MSQNSYAIQESINLLISGRQLNKNQCMAAMKEIMSGVANEYQIASFLTALRMKGETPEIISGAAQVMREFSNSISPKYKGRLVDTCGTGGDKSGTFNISTLAALVSAGAGVPVAKHGNRSISSKCGSADLLAGFGVNINLKPNEVESMISKIGIGFMFAPKFHPAMKFAMSVRRGLKMRTIFNILGPLTNPANAKAHVLGVFSKDLMKPMLEVMKDLGAEHVFVVHSEPGIDEIVPLSNVFIGELKDGEINFYTKTPNDYNLPNFTLQDIKGGDLTENLKIAANILTNKDNGIKRKIVVINAAYAIIASGLATDLNTAISLAEDSLTNRDALQKLEEMVSVSGGSLDKFYEIIG